jgi:hypothetical protein
MGPVVGAKADIRQRFCAIAQMRNTSKRSAPNKMARIRFCRVQAFPNSTFHSLFNTVFKKIRITADLDWPPLSGPGGMLV